MSAAKVCPCGCGEAVSSGRTWARAGCYWRAQPAEARRLRAVNAVGARLRPNMTPAHRSRASEQRHQTISELLTLAVEQGQVREAIQRAYLAGYTAGYGRQVRARQREVKL